MLVVVLSALAAGVEAQVTTRDDTVGRLLNEWHGKGRGAGLSNITYENRDGAHSPFNTAVYPQLKVFKPDAKSGNPIGLAEVLRGGPTVGNCSMAAPATNGGSLPRFYQMTPKGMQFLMLQYLSNQLFVYPEHQDYDAGANGVGGYGDLYLSNNATTVISQGSSGSDQPFLKALFSTLAALPPDTQQLLIDKRILMPTVQSIFRKSNKMVVNDEDYFSGAAHPPAFDAAQLDEEKMVRAAHDMTPALIPPLVQAQVKEETGFVPGKHFFEVPNAIPHKLADTPVAITRLMRGNMAQYEMTLSAAKAADLMGRPLQVRWEVLQGDPKAIEITSSKSGAEAQMRLRWQPPIKAATGIRSHRVDIGVFATNGIAASAPAFVSFYFLPNERHFYDEQGRVAEIYYQAHNPDLGLPMSDVDRRWLKLMLAVTLKGDGLRSRLMERLLSPKERDAILAVWLPLNEKERALQEIEGQARNKERTTKLRTELETELAASLAAKLPGDPQTTLRTTLERALTGIVEFADLYPSFQPELDAMAAKSAKTSARSDLRADIGRLIDLGVLIEQASGNISPVAAIEKLSPAERYYIGGLNLTLLSQVLFPEALERSTAPAWVDPRLTTPKPWRDVYRYEPTTGAPIGWLRHGGGRVAAFDTEGRFLPEGFKHPEVTQTVIYEKNAKGVLEWRVP